jgi:hypothetical protein
VKYGRHSTAYLIALISVICCSCSNPVLAQAPSQNVPSNGGIRITPAITQINLQPNENTLTLQYIVTNLTHQPLSIALSARDFGALSQSGSITLYGSEYTPSSNPHGIQSYVAFPSPSVLVPANISKQVDVMVVNATKLAPGGHYGVILFSPQSAFTQSGSNRVNLNTSVAGLVFLTTAHGGTYGVSASMSHVSPVSFKLPDSVYLVFKNTGNTQTVPQGQLTLYGPNSKILGTQVVNNSSGLILSGGSRIFQEQLPLDRHWYTPPGLYHFSLQYKDSQDASFQTLNQSFVYLNWRVTLLGLAALIATVYLVKRFGVKVVKRLASIKFRKRAPKPTPPVIAAPRSKVMDIVSPKRPNRK